MSKKVNREMYIWRDDERSGRHIAVMVGVVMVVRNSNLVLCSIVTNPYQFRYPVSHNVGKTTEDSSANIKKIELKVDTKSSQDIRNFFTVKKKDEEKGGQGSNTSCGKRNLDK